VPLRNAHVVTFKPRGVTDSIDGTNAEQGQPQAPTSLLSGRDIVPSMHTRDVWVPRPASFKLFDFSTFTGPVAGEALFEIGNRVYGFIATQRFPGHSEPFCYDFSINGFIPISGVTEANTPLSIPTTGDWTPPTITRVAAWTLFTHPGFRLPNAFGWLDQTNFTDTATGDTGFNDFGGVWDTSFWDASDSLWAAVSPAGGTVISNLSKNVLNAGWRPGQVITDSAGAIQVGTTIVGISADGLSIELSMTTTGPPVVGDVLVVTGGTTMHPRWAAGNTDANPLPGVATAVSLFNGRAEYAVDNAVLFSDSGDPLERSSADQAVTIQNGLQITALATIPFNNATQIGGVVNALLLFQADGGIWQVTGDPVTKNLAFNFLSPLGTLAPLTISTCPLGLFFIAPDGLRLIQLDGTVSTPISANGQGVAAPFINAQFPSRMVAAFNEDVYRVSVTGETTIGGSPVPAVVSSEYWFHMKLQAWSGPHTFPAKLITPSDRAATNHGFLMFPLVVNSSSGSGIVLDPSGGIVVDASGGIVLAPGAVPEIWFSNTRPLIDSAYIEDGRQMTVTYATTLLPDTLQMFENMVVETAIMIGLAPPGSFSVQRSGLWDQAIWDRDVWPGLPDGVWDQAIWDQGLWAASIGSLWDQAIWDGDLWDATATPVSPPQPSPSIRIPGQIATVKAIDEAGETIAQTEIAGFAPLPGGTALPGAAPGIWDQAIWDQSLWGASPGGAIVTQRRAAWPQPVVFKQMVLQVTVESSPHVAIGNVYMRYQQLGYMIQDYANVVASGLPGAIGTSGAINP